LVGTCTLIDAEIAFVLAQACQSEHQLTFAIFLKMFQRLGCFPPFEGMPSSIVYHIRGVELPCPNQAGCLTAHDSGKYCYRKHVRLADN